MSNILSIFDCTELSNSIKKLQAWNTQYTYNCLTEKYVSGRLNRRLKRVQKRLYKYQFMWFKRCELIPDL